MSDDAKCHPTDTANSNKEGEDSNATGTSNNATSIRNNTEMIHACSVGNVDLVQTLLLRHESHRSSQLSASLQDDATGQSPLMAAAQSGHIDICKLLLRNGAPWNAVDREGRCAGNYATDAEHWDVVNLLVEEGTKAELILGVAMRSLKRGSYDDDDDNDDDDNDAHKQSQQTRKEQQRPVEHEPCTKPDYLERNVRYNADETALLDDDDDAVMMEWERPLMEAHASIITSNGTTGKRVLNVGFGMGIVDTYLQTHDPSLHVIIEAHPGVHAKMIKDGWDRKPGVRVEFGRWQVVVPKLIAEGVELDGIFYDTYGEHYTDMEDFHSQMVRLLAKPGGIYSFFNGLAPDNLFFHGVACQCVKLQLAKLGLDTEFAQCQIQVSRKEWEGVRRKYWHGRDTYYLPIATWNKDALAQGDADVVGSNDASKDCNETVTKKLKT